MKILVTGAGGFIGKNLVVKLNEKPTFEVLQFVRKNSVNDLLALISQADFVVHLAGENRPNNNDDFLSVNRDLTELLCAAIKKSGRKISLILASSTQAELDNPYGRSKRAAEQVVEQLARETNNSVTIYRLPGIFGKWCRPNYNSVIATFCHNIARDLPIQIDDPEYRLNIVYIDDLIASFIQIIEGKQNSGPYCEVQPTYSMSVGALAEQIRAFRASRDSLISERVGAGLTRALYATYISYLPKADFVYEVTKYEDPRGVFVEMLKTQDSGQFSFFTAHPGITRGGHYHHSKTEKFLVIKGKARFGFRHILTNELHEIFTSGDKPTIVEMIPGWAHDITNVGDDEMIVMLWANEIFDRAHPDTYACPV